MEIYSPSTTCAMAQADSQWPLTTEYNSWKIHVGFGVDKVEMGQVFPPST